MRHALAFFLGVLFLILIGLTLGYLSLDFSAPGGPQLSLAGALAYEDCGYYGDCDQFTVYSGGPLDTTGEGTVYYDALLDPYNEWTTYYGDPPDPDSIYYDSYYDPRYVPPEDREVVVEEWVEYNSYSAPDNNVYDPWYVRAFPGFGQMAQQIIPGLQVVAPSYRPTSVSPPRPSPTVYPQPSCWITGNPSTVSYGGTSVLQWASFNATQATLTDIGRVPTSGSRMVTSLSGERIYALSVTGPGGSGSCYTRIVVSEPEQAAPVCIISAYPSVIHRGASTSLAWGSQSASSALLSGVGAVAPRGGMYIAPQQSTTYTLTVYGKNNRSSTCAVYVTVNP